MSGDVSLRLVRDMIYGCAEHRTWAYLRGEGDFDPEATADAIVDLVLGGLLKRDRVDGAKPDLADRLEKAIDRLENLAARSEA